MGINRAPVGVPFMAGFESTYLPRYGVDVTQSSAHDRLWRSDVDHAVAAGAAIVRYPLRWHAVEREPARYDWSVADAVMEHLRAAGVDVVLDLLHHTDYPDHLTDGFRDRRFSSALVAFAEAAAARYPWVAGYTIVNEPFATLFLAGHEALWPPYDRGVPGFVRLLRSVLPALSRAADAWREAAPQADHIWIDTCEHHQGTQGAAEYAALANDRRHVVLDLALGAHLEADRPFLREVLAAGGEDLLSLPPVTVDVLGLDYYCHSEWYYDDQGSRSPSPRPLGLAALAEQYHHRYELPLLLTETNIRGLPSDRATWLRYTLEQYEGAVARGVPLLGFGWFPHVDSCDWDSLLARPAGRTDPVGVLGRDRQPSCFTLAWAAAAGGAPSGDLPAYELQEPCRHELSGYRNQMRSWPWEPPPRPSHVPPVTLPASHEETPVTSVPDLVVLSHLRWDFVWQRPQHLVSRLAARRRADGARTWFVEEPSAADVREPTLRQQDAGPVTRVWLEVPVDVRRDTALGFGCRDSEAYGKLLVDLLAAEGRPAGPDVWVYTPMAMDLAAELAPTTLVYDVMDDLSSFLNAPRGLRMLQRRLLGEADVVFTGGRSLHEQVLQVRSHGVHLFASGVEPAHYARSRSLRRPHEVPVAGYVGVVDERLDLPLLANLADALPDWRIQVVGPVAKISLDDLPRRANLEWLGPREYDELPQVMAGFDVALMPFALNDATRSISPTKTLEYLAAGLPVVSTRVPDVVADYPGLVHLADASSFADACRHVLTHPLQERDRRFRRLRETRDWDTISEAMHVVLTGTSRAEVGALEGEATA